MIMKTTICKLLSIPLLVSALNAGVVDAASQSVTTSLASKPAPGGTIMAAPTNTGIVGPNIVAPTPNIAAVARSLDLRTRSLTSQVSFRPGMAPSKPVNIIVEFSSPASQYRAPAQTYDTRQGNRFLYNDLIAGASSSIWGRPRAMSIKVTFTEGNSTYVMPLNATLDPLFDVSITPLRFTLNNDCDRFGKSEIRFEYRRPDGQIGKKNFSTSKKKTTTINEFAWSAQEVSGSAKVFWPEWHFYESDPAETGVYLEGFGPPKYRLLPTNGGFVGRTIKSWHGQSCWADTKFDIVSTLRTYTSL